MSSVSWCGNRICVWIHGQLSSTTQRMESARRGVIHYRGVTTGSQLMTLALLNAYKERVDNTALLSYTSASIKPHLHITAQKRNGCSYHA